MELQEQVKKLQQNKAMVQQIMSSSDGQKLLRILTQDGGAQLKDATDAASRGNTADMVRMIAEVMRSDEGAKLVKKINSQIK